MTELNRTQREKTISLLKRKGIMRLSELMAEGISQPTLSRLVNAGELVRPARGLYELAETEFELTHTLATVTKRVPRGVICLISALQYHDITLQTSNRVWVAIGESDRKPQLHYPKVRIVRFGEKAFERGIESHRIDGVAVRIFDPAKSVVDCFRYRNTVGLDVALEALRVAIRKRKASPDSIAEYAKALRIWSVLQPYIVTTAADEG
ncbi:type IV toxin-antitoxin system AbiEi family antitoxin domain-containing protein [Hyphomonas sp.]|uniref:type IV toxin-antitoxin system AbiEi family antitoxin domain-containing protein n=1 Tax=Hyphomonas sp. TaxID=87 RepID=UPI0025BA54A3|nr:type IV toxin-antitoxin system AbiEi family antitoxin domain-containing protein [Hyphomonas sp.]MBI1401035.1 transcriptional regulator [Hyphomonas sp.]